MLTWLHQRTVDNQPVESEMQALNWQELEMEDKF